MHYCIVSADVKWVILRFIIYNSVTYSAKIITEKWAGKD